MRDPHLFHVEALLLIFGGAYSWGLVTSRGIAGFGNNAILFTCLKGWGRCHSLSGRSNEDLRYQPMILSLFK